MEIINSILGAPLGFIIYLAYQLSGSYGGAVLIFSVVVKIVLFPITFMAHKNAIRFLKLQPALNIIKRRYSDDKEELNEEQYQLFKKEKYNVFIGMLPLIFQLILIMGMLQVMYRPLEHMLRLDQSVIDTLVETYHYLFGNSGGSMVQLEVLQAIQDPEYFAMFQNALADYSGFENILSSLAHTNLNFMGINLGIVPSLANITIEWFVPLAAGLFSLIFCLVNNKLSPGAMTQSKQANMGMTAFTVLLSLYFAFVMPAGVGLYWAVGNLFGIVMTLLFELIYSPRKVATEAVAYLDSKKKTSAEVKKEKAQKKLLSMREKTDVGRFRQAEKELVFYALNGGQYKYYKNIIEYLLEHSDVVIHYLTNDPEDVVFQLDHERIEAYYASQRKTISLLLKLKTKIFFTTVPDLQVYHMKRSIVQEDIEYIHIIHGIPSAHMTAREKAYDHFDTIFCVGPHHVRELQRRIQIANLPSKNLVKAGYPVYDQLIESYSERRDQVNDRPQILIAPSWQKENILETCIDEILDALVGKGYQIIVRPHIQFTIMFPDRMEELAGKYAKYTTTEEIIFDLNFAENKYIFTADLLMTDWSGIAYEFSYCGLRPSVFINTPMKVLNPNYELYGLEVTDITLRDKVGISVDIDQLEMLGKKIASLLANKDEYKERIQEVVENHLFYPRRSGEAGGRYIINQLEKRR
jgi:YidC/Oxa1 family membrane protein insertase